MSLLSVILPQIGQPDKTEDPKINNAFTAIQSWANGNIDAGNFASPYKDGAANLACLRTLGTGPTQAAQGSATIYQSSGHSLELKHAEESPFCGGGSGEGFSYLSEHISFPTACVYALIAGFNVYDSTNKTLATVSNPIMVRAFPKGKNVEIVFQNMNVDAGNYIRADLYALGY